MDIEELRQKVSSPRESAKLDFKLHLYKINEPKPTVPAEIQKWKDDREKQWGELVKDMIALTNGNVGTAKQTAYLIIGADDKLRADGTPNLQDISDVPTRRDIYDKINSYCEPRLPELDCQTLLLEGKHIFVVSIPPSPYLHRLSKQLKTPKKDFSPHTALIRRGDGEETYEADPGEQATLQREKACLFSTDAASSQLIAIDWKQICHNVLEKQNRQWLTTHPLGAGARRVADMYVPLELVERRAKPARINQPLDPAQWSVREAEKTTPILPSQFFEDVIKQGKSSKSQGKRVAIVGEPGAGKTTLLQKIAWEVDSYPIWINLADLKPDDTLQEYLLEKWLKPSLSVIRQYAPETVPNLSEPTEALKTAFLEAFGQGQICLLLNGVDEMAVKIGQPLSWIAKELQNGWVAEAKIVLTCRINVWSAEGSRLENQFDVYRNLDFSPEQVEEFIDKWFADPQEHSSRNALKDELGGKGDRINRLVRNPLRLTLVCLTWNGLGDKLPETKAGLYQRLVKGHYQWKEEHQEFVMPEERRDELERQLGELAKAALDSKEARFRLRESYIENFLGRRKQEQSLFWWAIKLGWLIPIGLPSVEEKDADEPVYAFFHPTFQEYFAALAINKWHYFLNHTPHNPDEGSYRVFETHWKEVLLLWLGRNNIQLIEHKENLISALIEFDDSFGHENFYRSRGFLLASLGIKEFRNCSNQNKLIEMLIIYSFLQFEGDKRWDVILLRELVAKVLKEAHLDAAVNFLTQLFHQADNDKERMRAAKKIKEIHLENETASAFLMRIFDAALNECEQILLVEDIALTSSRHRSLMIDFLVEILQTSNLSDANEDNRIEAAEVLGRIDPGNEMAISFLCRVLTDELLDITDQSIFRYLDPLHKLASIGENQPLAVETIQKAADHFEKASCDFLLAEAMYVLGHIRPDNKKSVEVLSKLLQKSSDESLREYIAVRLGLINQSNHLAVSFLENLILSTQDEDVKARISSDLREIDPNNKIAFKALIQQVENTDRHLTALLSLTKSSPIQGSQLREAVMALKEHITENSFQNSFERYVTCRGILQHCAFNMSYLDFYRAWYSELSIPASGESAKHPK